MQIFLFPRCQWKYILFLLFFIFSFLQNAIIRWISMDSKDVAQPFLNTYLFNISDYIAIIPTIIIFIRSRKIRKEMNESNPKIQLIYNQGDKKSANFKWLILLVALFDFGSHISSLLFYIV